MLGRRDMYWPIATRTRRKRDGAEFQCCVSHAAATSFPGTGFVDGEAATIDLLAVEGGDGGLGLLVAAHLDEAEALGPPRVPVHDDLRRLDGAVLIEHLLQIAVGHRVGQVAHVQLLAHLGLQN